MKIEIITTIICTTIVLLGGIAGSTYYHLNKTKSMIWLSPLVVVKEAFKSASYFIIVTFYLYLLDAIS